MALWNLPCGCTTGWNEIMAQIILPRTPQGPLEYNKVQIDKLVANLEQLILLLNSTYTPETLRNDDEAFAWFNG